VIRQLDLAFGRDRDFEVKGRQVISGPGKLRFWEGSPAGFRTGGLWSKRTSGRRASGPRPGFQVGDVIAFGERPRTP